MCGVVGYAPNTGGHVDAQATRAAFGRLFRESTVRGLHAFGLGQTDRVLRCFDTAAVAEAFQPDQRAIAHARYATSGDWHDHRNNQPIEVRGLLLAFNGVIHQGTKAEFEAAFGVRCEHDNDGEVFVRRVLEGADPVEFLRGLAGSFAGVWLRSGVLYAARNDRRPLWRSRAHGGIWYASTRDIFVRAGFPAPTLVPAWSLEVS